MKYYEGFKKGGHEAGMKAVFDFAKEHRGRIPRYIERAHVTVSIDTAVLGLSALMHVVDKIKTPEHVAREVLNEIVKHKLEMKAIKAEAEALGGDSVPEVQDFGAGSG